MVDQIAARGVSDARLLAALHEVPRHLFVVPEQQESAYEDRALPLARGATISQPYMVALMLEALALDGSERALEVGAGSGYAAALLARLAREVFAIELDPELSADAARRLSALGVRNVTLRSGDGSGGWPEHAPFDAILVSAAAPTVPPALEAQLAALGRLVLPVGPATGSQLLVRIARLPDGSLERRELCEVQFVPLVGVTPSSR